MCLYIINGSNCCKTICFDLSFCNPGPELLRNTIGFYLVLGSQRFKFFKQQTIGFNLFVGSPRFELLKKQLVLIWIWVVQGSNCYENLMGFSLFLVVQCLNSNKKTLGFINLFVIRCRIVWKQTIGFDLNLDNTRLELSRNNNLFLFGFG